MFALSNVIVGLALGCAALYIFWRQEKAAAKDRVLCVIRNDGRIEEWTEQDDRGWF